MRTPIAAAILMMLCASVRAQTLTECGKSDGYAYYFVGGLVPADKGGWRKDGIDGGRIIFEFHKWRNRSADKERHRYNCLRKARWGENNPETDEQRSNCADCFL
jgi:hypothetical protein